MLNIIYECQIYYNTVAYFFLFVIEIEFSLATDSN
jgi:hypothetical protein